MRNLAINNATILTILIVGLIAVIVSRSDPSIRIGDEVSMLIRESAENKRTAGRAVPGTLHR